MFLVQLVYHHTNIFNPLSNRIQVYVRPIFYFLNKGGLKVCKQKHQDLWAEIPMGTQDSTLQENPARSDSSFTIKSSDSNTRLLSTATSFNNCTLSFEYLECGRIINDFPQLVLGKFPS